MKIIWDEPKRLANIKKHGFDFADIDGFDWENAIIEKSLTEPGSSRFKAIGYFQDGTTAVVFATVGTEAISVISFRRASFKERRKLPWPKLRN
ncbi:BrnT family toxin [Rhizobium sp. GR12]|uniref:BrnT family toxin n=1 Tax=Rhizobium sp. GR12 TaxID=3053925 RepID=UPI002FBE61B9